MPAYDRPEGRAGGVEIEGTGGLRQGWTGEGKPKARRQWVRPDRAENPAARIARRAERKGALRLKIE